MSDYIVLPDQNEDYCFGGGLAVVLAVVQPNQIRIIIMTVA
jgi:hypothetical protein